MIMRNKRHIFAKTTECRWMIAASIAALAMIASAGRDFRILEKEYSGIKECRDDVDYTLTHPHETDCNLYYECNRGKLILRKCPDTLRFNPAVGVCDWPEMVTCEKVYDEYEDDNIESSTFESTTYPAHPECPISEVVIRLPHEKNCSLYYVCQDGKKTVHVCPEGMHFNIVISMCDWPASANCTLPDEPNSSDSEESTEISVPKLSCIGGCPLADPIEYTVQLPANDCTKFCKCSNGVAIIESCPEGLHYDKKIQVCNWPNNANCL